MWQSDIRSLLPFPISYHLGIWAQLLNLTKSWQLHLQNRRIIYSLYLNYICTRLMSVLVIASLSWLEWKWIYRIIITSSYNYKNNLGNSLLSILCLYIATKILLLLYFICYIAIVEDIDHNWWLHRTWLASA